MPARLGSPSRRQPRRGGASGAMADRDECPGQKGRILSMLRRLLLVWLLMILATAANAADQPPGNSPGITGLFVTTRYPALTVRAGETTTIDLSVRNFKLPPQLLQLSAPQVPDGWKATILGGGQPVGALEVAPDAEERLQLRLEPSAGLGPGDYYFIVEAK